MTTSTTTQTTHRPPLPRGIDAPIYTRPTFAWDDGDDIQIPLGPPEPLDDCPDCHGRVQRLARHTQGLGEMWEHPLTLNTSDQPMGPRTPGAGVLSYALDAVEDIRGEGR